MNKKKAAAAMAAVTLYIKTQEEALVVMEQPAPPMPRLNLWALAGRQDIMQTRQLFALRAFNQTRNR